MCRCRVVLALDSTAVEDAAADLEALDRALAGRSDGPSQALADMLDRLEATPGVPVVTSLGNGHVMISAPPEWSAVLGYARRLGLL